MAARIPYISHSVTVVPAGAADAAVLNDNVVDGGTQPDPPAEYSEWKEIRGAVLGVTVSPGWRVSHIYCTLVEKTKALDIGSKTKFFESETRLNRNLSVGDGSRFESALPFVQGRMRYVWDSSEYPGHYYLHRDTLSCVEGITVECEPTDGRSTVILKTGSTVGGTAAPRTDAKSGTPGSRATFNVNAKPNPGFKFVEFVSETPGVTITPTGALAATVSYPFPSFGSDYISVIAKFESTVGPHPYPPPSPPDPDNPYPPDDPWDPDDPMTRKYGYIIVRTRPDDSARGSTEPTEAIYAGMPGQYQKIRIVATANDGYAFLKWTNEYGSDVATSEVYEQTFQFPAEGERTYLTFVGNFYEPGADEKRVVLYALPDPYGAPEDMLEYGAYVSPRQSTKYGYPGQTIGFRVIATDTPEKGFWFREWNTARLHGGTTLSTDRDATLNYSVTNDPNPQEHTVYGYFDYTGLMSVACAFDEKATKTYIDKHCALGHVLDTGRSASKARSRALAFDEFGKTRVVTVRNDAYTLDAEAYTRAWCIPADGYVGLKAIFRWFGSDGEVYDEYEWPWDADVFENPSVGIVESGNWLDRCQIIFVLRHPGTGKILHGANKKILHGAAGSVLYDD